MAKRVPPAAVVSVTSIRKAMGVSPEIQNVNEGVRPSASGDHMHVDTTPQTGGMLLLQAVDGF